jgi:hypothetical protein
VLCTNKRLTVYSVQPFKSQLGCLCKANPPSPRHTSINSSPGKSLVSLGLPLLDPWMIHTPALFSPSSVAVPCPFDVSLTRHTPSNHLQCCRRILARVYLLKLPLLFTSEFCLTPCHREFGSHDKSANIPSSRSCLAPTNESCAFLNRPSKHTNSSIDLRQSASRSDSPAAKWPIPDPAAMPTSIRL